MNDDTAVFAGAAGGVRIGVASWTASRGVLAYWISVAVVCAIYAMAVVVAGMRAAVRRTGPDDRGGSRGRGGTSSSRAAAAATEMTESRIAARYRSATRRPRGGGDLYEIIPNGHGIRG